ncbi:hypothetical protein Ocin01_18327 [Orchesella cincta]|uniref:Uncharacterized protein n=1 Tax=Orchesella cincta TaxID=48709 RepID=A0A1D2M5U6_ORCCI|nr:hypothetical protein Ocin01_18327 [Orchesella cincta]
MIRSPPQVPRSPSTTDQTNDSAEDVPQAEPAQQEFCEREATEGHVETVLQRTAKGHFETSGHGPRYVGNPRLQQWPASVVNFYGPIHNLQFHLFDGNSLRRGTELAQIPTWRNELIAPSAPPAFTSFQANTPGNSNSSKKAIPEASLALATNNGTGEN